MKLILALFLCCVSASSSDSCSSDVLKQCNSFDPRGPNKRYITTEEDLETYCQSVVRCSIEYWDRCGTSASDGFDMTATHEQYKKIYKAVCGKRAPYRRKYLANIECVNEEMNQLSKKCGRADGTGEQDKIKLCKEIEKVTNCAHKAMAKECGRDARDVFAAIYPDNKDYYGC